MGTLLAAMRTRIRDDMDDSAGDVWTDSELDRHIANALARLSHYRPRERKSTLATVADTRDLDVSSITPRIVINAIEYPKGTDPKSWADFTLWIDNLRIVSGSVPDGADAEIYWTAPHTLSVSESTLSEDDEETVLIGAEGFACRQQAWYQANRLATGGPTIDRDWQSDYKQLLGEFHAAIRTRRSLRSRRLYSPAQPLATQDTDPGPGAP